MTGTGGLQRVPSDFFVNYQIPLPPLETQRQIVDEIAAHQRIIDGARQVVKGWKPNIEVELAESLPDGIPQWNTAPLFELFIQIRNGKNVEQLDEEGKYRVSRIQTISNWNVDLEKTKWTNDEVKEDDFLQEGDILLSHINSMEHLAKSALFTGISEKVVHGVNLIKFRPDKTKVLPEYAYLCFVSDKFISTARIYAQKAVNQASIKISDLMQIQIALPPLDIQREIVARIEHERAIVEGARELIWLYEEKVKKVIEKVWEG